METHDLNPRQKHFAEKVASGIPATDAYLQAGYRPASRPAAQSASSRLQNTSEIAAYIRELRRPQEERSQQETILAIRDRLADLTHIILTGAGSEAAQIAEYHHHFKGGGTATRLPCKLKALRDHSKLVGHLDPAPLHVHRAK